MGFIKGILKLIISLVTFAVIVPALAIAVLPMSAWVTQLGGTYFAFFTQFWWMPLAIGGVASFLVFVFVKMLPIRNNTARFFTELAVYGLYVGGLVYFGFTKIPLNAQILPAEAVAFAETYVPFISVITGNNLFIILTGGALVLLCLLIDLLARKHLSPRRKAVAKKDYNYGRNVVSSAEVDRVDLSAVKPKRYVKDIWGHYIEEDEYNARINSAKEKRF